MPATQPAPTLIVHERVDASRIGWVSLLATVAAVMVNTLICTVAVAVLSIPPALPMFAGVYIPFTVIGVLGATLAFALVVRLSKTPIRTFRILALGVLLISFLPDMGLLNAELPGMTAAAVASLMLMHIATATISVGLLTTLTRAKG